jgi:acylphosphatase
MGLSGWVRNLPDGRLEVLASGAASVLDMLEAILREGPPHAQVQGVEISEVLDELQALKTFEIKR